MEVSEKSTWWKSSCKRSPLLSCKIHWNDVRLNYMPLLDSSDVVFNHNLHGVPRCMLKPQSRRAIVIYIGIRARGSFPDTNWPVRCIWS